MLPFEIFEFVICVPIAGFRNYGVPTIRTDLPAPRIKRVSDRTNYGDESDAYGLTNPSIYSSKGVYEKDFLMPRNKEEVCIVIVELSDHFEIYHTLNHVDRRCIYLFGKYPNIYNKCPLNRGTGQLHDIRKSGLKKVSVAERCPLYSIFWGQVLDIHIQHR